MMYDAELEEELIRFVERGKKGSPKFEANREYTNESHRSIMRKWRQLLAEAKYDIPQFLWKYIDWSLPPKWLQGKNYRNIYHHKFTIRLPGFLPVDVIYKVLSLSEWSFSKFEISGGGQYASSTKYDDLAFFLGMAHQYKKTKKKVVVIEEIDGELTKGVNLKSIKKPQDEPDENNPYWYLDQYNSGCD